MTIDPTPLSAVNALKANLQSQISNAAQASSQASQRKAIDQTTANAQSGAELNTAAGSFDPFRGNRVNTTA